MYNNQISSLLKTWAVLTDATIKREITTQNVAHWSKNRQSSLYNHITCWFCPRILKYQKKLCTFFRFLSACMSNDAITNYRTNGNSDFSLKLSFFQIDKIGSYDMHYIDTELLICFVFIMHSMYIFLVDKLIRAKGVPRHCNINSTYHC